MIRVGLKSRKLWELIMGLTPRQYASGEINRQGSISKDEPVRVCTRLCVSEVAMV